MGRSRRGAPAGEGMAATVLRRPGSGDESVAAGRRGRDPEGRLRLVGPGPEPPRERRRRGDSAEGTTVPPQATGLVG